MFAWASTFPWNRSGSARLHIRLFDTQQVIVEFFQFFHFRHLHNITQLRGIEMRISLHLFIVLVLLVDRRRFLAIPIQ